MTRESIRECGMLPRERPRHHMLRAVVSRTTCRAGLTGRRIPDSNVEIEGAGGFDHGHVRCTKQRQRGIATTPELGHHRAYRGVGVVRTREGGERGVL